MHWCFCNGGSIVFEVLGVQNWADQFSQIDANDSLPFRAGCTRRGTLNTLLSVLRKIGHFALDFGENKVFLCDYSVSLKLKNRQTRRPQTRSTWHYLKLPYGRFGPVFFYHSQFAVFLFICQVAQARDSEIT